MKTFNKVPTQQFWEAIEHNAQMGQRHVNWVEYLDNIKVLCALIDERVQAHQRRMRLPVAAGGELSQVLQEQDLHEDAREHGLHVEV